MTLMGGDALHTTHATTLIYPTLTTTMTYASLPSFNLSFGYSYRLLSLLLLLLLPNTFSNAIPSRKHILAFVGHICCIIHPPN